MTQIAMMALLSLAALYSTSEPRNYSQLTDFSIVYEYASANRTYFDDSLFIQHDVYNLSASNQFALLSYQSQNYLVDKENNFVINYSENFDCSYLSNDSFLLLIENELIKYDTANSKLTILESDEEIVIGTRESNILFYDYYTDIEDELDTPTIEIPNSFYLKKLKNNYGANNNNECGIIASQILLGYLDTFNNDLIVDENYDIPSGNTDNSEILSDWFISPGTDIRTEAINPFKNYLETFFNGTFDDGMLVGEAANTIRSYLNSQNISYSMDEHSVLHVVDYAKATINSGRPVILCGGGHFCVAYGYNDTKFFVCDGNGGVGTIQTTIYHGTFVLTWSTGCIGLQINSPHVHSDNYYSYYHDTYYCPCGVKMKNISITPSAWNFEAQYFFNSSHKYHTFGGIDFESQRLRTGFIENEVVNLSPRRQNAGNSYLKVETDEIITKIDINMAWWSNSENQNSGTARLYYEEAVNQDLWQTRCDILNDLSFPLSHSSLANCSFVMPEEASGFMFVVTNQAVGTTNKGRLSLGDINIKYIVNSN